MYDLKDERTDDLVADVASRLQVGSDDSLTRAMARELCRRRVDFGAMHPAYSNRFADLLLN